MIPQMQSLVNVNRILVKMAELAGSMSSVTHVNVYQNTVVPCVNLVSIISELHREQDGEASLLGLCICK